MERQQTRVIRPRAMAPDYADVRYGACSGFKSDIARLAEVPRADVTRGLESQGLSFPVAGAFR